MSRLSPVQTVLSAKLGGEGSGGGHGVILAWDGWE